MKLFFKIIFTIFIVSCSPRQADNNTSFNILNTNKHDTIYGESNQDYYSENDTFYIVVADTGIDYYNLQKQMVSIANTTNIKIDTMGRFYDNMKDLIKLPDNDEDEIYRGDYYPRRFPSNNLSLEYLSIYKPNSRDKTIAIVTGIYETKRSADSAKKSILNIQPNTFIIKSEIYTGCMH